MRHRSVNRATQNRGAVVLVKDKILQPKNHWTSFSYDYLSPQLNAERRDQAKKLSERSIFQGNVSLDNRWATIAAKSDR